MRAVFHTRGRSIQHLWTCIFKLTKIIRWDQKCSCVKYFGMWNRDFWNAFKNLWRFSTTIEGVPHAAQYYKVDVKRIIIGGIPKKQLIKVGVIVAQNLKSFQTFGIGKKLSFTGYLVCRNWCSLETRKLKMSSLRPEVPHLTIQVIDWSSSSSVVPGRKIVICVECRASLRTRGACHSSSKHSY